MAERGETPRAPAYVLLSPPSDMAPCEVRPAVQWRACGRLLFCVPLTKSVVFLAIRDGDAPVVDCLMRLQDGWAAAELEVLAQQLSGDESLTLDGFPERLPAEQGGSLCLHVQSLRQAGRRWQVEAWVPAEHVLTPPRVLSANPKQNASRFPAFADFLLSTFGAAALSACNGVLDVAGGAGGLAFELSVRRQVPCVVVDPRPMKHTPTQRLVLDHRRKVCAALAPWADASPLARSTIDKFTPRPVRQLLELFEPAAVLRGGQATVEHDAIAASSVAASVAASSVASAAREASVIVGLHPDQALDAIIDAALELRKPFAVAPCCVFWKHGRNAHRTTPAGTPVRTYEQLCDYVAARAPGIREASLPFIGLNRVFYWTPPDGQHPEGLPHPTAASAPPLREPLEDAPSVVCQPVLDEERPHGARAEGEMGMADDADTDDLVHHNCSASITGRDARHAVFAKWIVTNLLSPPNLRSPPNLLSPPPAMDSEGVGRVLDVAGGKGGLSLALAQRGVPTALIDPCALSGREPGSCGFFPPQHSMLRAAAVDGHHYTETATDAAHTPPPIATDAACLTDAQLVRVVRLTLEKALTEPSLTMLLERSLALVGMHADEATEALVDAALERAKPFAVLPCCVLPQLFPKRRLASNVFVRKYGAFIRYLREKDPRIQRAELPFAGRATVLFMRQEDYQRAWIEKGHGRPSVSDCAPCALAARAGDLALLRRLRSVAQPWDLEVARCGAWYGHLTLLQWAEANGCPWDWQMVSERAAAAGHTAIVEWARAR